MNTKDDNEKKDETKNTKVVPDKEPDDEYTIQMRAFGTIPAMRSLPLTGSKCKVCIRGKKDTH